MIKLIGVEGYDDQGGPEFHGLRTACTFEEWKMIEDSYPIHFWLQVDGDYDHKKYHANDHLFHTLVRTHDDEEFEDLLKELGLKDLKEINEWEEKNDHWTPRYNEQWELQFKKIFDSEPEIVKKEIDPMVEHLLLKSKESLEKDGFIVHKRIDFEKDKALLFEAVSSINDQGWDEYVNGELHDPCDCPNECEFEPTMEQKLKWLEAEMNFPEWEEDTNWEIFLEYIMGAGYYTYEREEIVAWRR